MKLVAIVASIVLAGSMAMADKHAHGKKETGAPKDAAHAEMHKAEDAAMTDEAAGKEMAEKVEGKMKAKAEGKKKADKKTN